ncbi:MAG: thermonuclease family protein [Coriobacteriia bacterium]
MWYSKLPKWGKVLFIACWPVSIPYAIFRMWKRGKGSFPIRLFATGFAATAMLFLSLCTAAMFSPPVDATSDLQSDLQSGKPQQSIVSTSGSTSSSESTSTLKPKEAADSSSIVTLLPATVVRVVDGDTAVFVLENGVEEKVRFIGIDTPESTTEVEAYGKEASAYTTGVLFQGRNVFS